MARLEINQAELDRLLGPVGPVGLHVSKFGKSVARRAKAKALVDRGNMRRAIAAEGLNHSASGLSLVVRASDHASLVIHQGHKEIVKKKHMKFQPKDLRGSGQFIYTKRVRAVAGYPFLTSALDEANKALPIGQQFRIVILAQPRRGVQPAGAPRLDYPRSS